MGHQSEQGNNIPISDLTTFKVGGVAKGVITVRTTEELVNTLKKVKSQKIPHEIIAGGSNVVCADGTINTLFIHVATQRLSFDGVTVVCDAGVELATLINKSIDAGLSGLETLSGIPGSVGGALYGNAGAYGKTIGEVVKTVTFFDGEKVQTLSQKECQFLYRESIFKKQKEWVILSVVFTLEKGERHTLRKKSQEIINIREKKYKKGIVCPGSFFKNVLVKDVSEESLKKIPKDKIIEGKIPAGFLLEQVGACGMEYGGFSIAPFHGNLIINTKKGTFKEIRELSTLLKKKVFEKFGIELEEEVQFIE